MDGPETLENKAMANVDGTPSDRDGPTGWDLGYALEVSPRDSKRRLDLPEVHWGQKYYLPNFDSRRIILGNCMSLIQESPRQTKPKKGPKQKVHEFHPFCEFG